MSARSSGNMRAKLRRMQEVLVDQAAPGSDVPPPIETTVPYRDAEIIEYSAWAKVQLDPALGADAEDLGPLVTVNVKARRWKDSRVGPLQAFRQGVSAGAKRLQQAWSRL